MSLEEKIIAVLAQDLGPAAKVFLYRTCRQQLRKEPSTLDNEDIPQLASACYAGLGRTLGVPVAEKVKASLLTLR